MSEYQYYEFVAIDRPLTKEEQSELRSCTSRARITSTHFVNEYHWADLRDLAALTRASHLFASRLAEFRDLRSRKSSLIARLDAAGLI